MEQGRPLGQTDSRRRIVNKIRFQPGLGVGHPEHLCLFLPQKQGGAHRQQHQLQAAPLRHHPSRPHRALRKPVFSTGGVQNLDPAVLSGLHGVATDAELLVHDGNLRNLLDNNPHLLIPDGRHSPAGLPLDSVPQRPQQGQLGGRAHVQLRHDCVEFAVYADDQPG